MVPEKNIQCWSLFYETRFPAVFYQKQQPNQGFSKQASKVMRVFHDIRIKTNNLKRFFRMLHGNSIVGFGQNQQLN